MSEREAAQRIADAVRRVCPSDDGSFGRELACREAGGVLGNLGDVFSYGPDTVAELRLSRLLRHAGVAEIRDAVEVLTGVNAAPWPQVCAALASYVRGLA